MCNLIDVSAYILLRLYALVAATHLRQIAVCRWLHPAVMVLLAAFDTLTHEKHAKPAVSELGSETGSEQPSSKAQQIKQWLSSMLQFHK